MWVSVGEWEERGEVMAAGWAGLGGGLVGRGRSAKLGHGPVGRLLFPFLLAFFSFYLFSFLFYIILK